MRQATGLLVGVCGVAATAAAAAAAVGVTASHRAAVRLLRCRKEAKY
jgi:hypothetical protein